MNRRVVLDRADPWSALVVDDPFEPPNVVADQGDAVLPVTGGIFPAPPLVNAGTVAVIGAGGGVGASTIASGLALGRARMGEAPVLVDLDCERGDLAGAWGAPVDRSIADLVDVIDEIAAHHIQTVAHRHASGVRLLIAPPTGRSTPFDRHAEAERLIGACAELASPIVDVGSGVPGRISGAACGASCVIVVAPTIASARRARALVTAVAECGARRTLVVLNRGGMRDELSTRAFARAIERPVVAEVPKAMRDAHSIGSGIWPGRRRRPICTAIESLLEIIAAG